MPIEATPMPFDASKEWSLSEGVLRHHTGRFFSIVGVEAHGPRLPANGVAQPLIDQPEIGILGVLLRRISGWVELLLQAKGEPGNIGGVHLAPTVQATRSNYEQVHGGKPTPFLAYFLSHGDKALDQVQSEQGRFFLEKRNRNMAVWVSGDVEAEPGYRWTSLHELARLLHCPHVINSDLRSVLSCLDWSIVLTDPPEDDWGRSLLDSLRDQPGEDRDAEVDAWLSAARKQGGVDRLFRPLDQLPGWEWTPECLEDTECRRFRILQMAVEAPGREVPRWDQPLVACRSASDETLYYRMEAGRLVFGVALRTDPGVAHGVEWGLPSGPIQWPKGSHQTKRLTVATSEEGGRFHQVVSHYALVEVKGAVPPVEDFHWLTLGELKRQISLQNRVSNELRGAVALLFPFLLGRSA